MGKDESFERRQKRLRNHSIGSCEMWMICRTGEATGREKGRKRERKEERKEGRERERKRKGKRGRREEKKKEKVSIQILNKSFKNKETK